MLLQLFVWAQAAWAQMPSNHPTNPHMDWQIPAAVLVAGLLLGFLVMSRQKSTDEQIEVQSRRIDLQSTHDEVLEALKHLEIEQPKMDPAEYKAEREALLARGARAMGVLDGAQPAAAGEAPQSAPAPRPAAAEAPQAPASSPPPTGGLAPEWRGAMYALGAVAVIGGFVWFAQQGSKPRTGDMGMTGGDLVTGGDEAPNAQNAQFLQSVEMMKKRLEANPGDIDAMNGLTQLYFTHGDPATAMEWNTKALEMDEKNADARVYRAVLSAMMSMPDRAIEQLDEVLRDEPDHPKAVTYRGLILMELQRFEEAVVMLEVAVQQQPNNGVLQQALDQARALANGEVPPPMPPPPSAGGDLIVSGTVTLDPSVAGSIRGTETIFVSVADPARPGPPVAADKLGTTSFPAAFELTTADIRAMPGSGGVPATMDLKIRVDLDGNAMTKEPGPQAVVKGVSRGTRGLNVVLTMDGAPTVAPSGGGGAPAPAAATGQVLVSGTAKLAPGKTVTGSETVFISVKDPAGGPPLAADKRVGVTFPMDFQITDAQVLNMGGGPRPVPSTLVVSVRLDNDGNAMTKDGEPAATLEGVAKGTTGLDLTLQ